MGTDRNEFVNQNELLSMGWTKTLIEKYLPSPQLKQNPYYKSASPMKLWRKDLVLEVMRQADFKAALEKANSRKSSAVKAVTTKEENLKQLGTEFAKSIRISYVEDDEVLQNKAKKHAYQQFQEHRRDSEYYMPFSSYSSADEATVNRWVVNYIRHKLTSYDKKLLQLEGKVGKDKAYCLFRNLLLERIAEAYPKYAEECHRQMVDDSPEF